MKGIEWWSLFAIVMVILITIVILVLLNKFEAIFTQ
jgi:hypothetical protein